jgi:chromosome segregation ATPase
MDELRRERDELKEIVSTIGGEDLGALRQMAHEYEGMKHALKEVESQLQSLRTERESASSLLDEERTKNTKLVEVIDEIEKSQSQVIDRFEKELQERDRQIAQLREAQEKASHGPHASPDVSGTIDSLKEVLKQTEAKLELMEKDNTRLRKESTELGVMVQQCLEKIKRDLSDKPHWVDRRVVCSAIGTLLRDLEAIDERSETAADAHLSARQKLGDVLGLTFEERAAVGLLSIPNRFLQNEPEKFPSRSASIGEDFVSFLEREATNLKS